MESVSVSRRDFLKMVGLGAAGFAVGGGRAFSANKVVGKPNIVLIMADDMGYSDIGCYGGEIETPNIDRLAAGGLRFSQFYNGARCCPTRASLLTGLYAHQTGVGLMANGPSFEKESDAGLPGYRGFLNRNCVTIGEVLKGAGYHTLMSGKWHVGYHRKERWPLQRGFDRFYGIMDGVANYFHPKAPFGLWFGNERVEAKGENYYLTDAFTDYAIRFVKEARQQDDKPFFLYLAYTAPHWPLHARKEDMEKYRGRYMVGWDKIRAARYKRMVDMGFVKKEWELSARDARALEQLSEEKKKEMDFRMSIYAAQVDRMDQGIGRVVKMLKDMGELDNTLILFLSDNGGCAEGGELGGGKAEDLGSDRGFLLSYGQAWANASNTPYRRYKCWVYEGGISTPFIAYWPGVIKKGGGLTNEVGHIIDIMATCCDAAGAEYPKNYKGNNIIPPESKSLVPIFRGHKGQSHECLFWEHLGGRAVRRGKWKLVASYRCQWELYDMEADRTELTNLAEKHPEIVSELSMKYDEWAKRCGVEPWEKIRRIMKKQRSQWKAARKAKEKKGG